MQRVAFEAFSLHDRMKIQRPSWQFPKDSGIMVGWWSSLVFPHCSCREPRQARKGAAAAASTGAGAGLVGATSLN